MARPKQAKIWLKQNDESAVAFEAFRRYRDMGPDRSLDKLAKIYVEAGKEPSYRKQLGAWSAKYNWVARAEAYDAAQDAKKIEVQQQAMQEQGVDWAKRQLEQRETEWSMAQKLIERANQMLNHPLVQTKTEQDGKTLYISPAKWTAADIPKYVEIADRLARLAAELPTELVLFMQLLEKKKLPASEVFQDLLNSFAELDDN